MNRLVVWTTELHRIRTTSGPPPYTDIKEEEQLDNKTNTETLKQNNITAEPRSAQRNTAHQLPKKFIKSFK